MDPLAGTFITAALVLYSIGVWGERLVGRLAWWHLAFFVGGMTFDVHGISGLIAILLMLVHAAWALVVLRRGDAAAARRFHRFSIFVWLVWLVPYFSPMFFAIAT